MLAAVWLAACLELGVEPATAVIEKPLIALTLLHFGFQPRCTGSPAVELLVAPTGKDGDVIGLWTEQPRKLSSVVSNRTLKSQNMRFLEARPDAGRRVWINMDYTLSPDGLCALPQRIDALLGQDCNLDATTAYQIFCKTRKNLRGKHVD